MKKIFSVAIFISTIVLIGLLAQVVVNQNNELKLRALNKCEELSDTKEVQSIKSLGLVVRGRALLAVLVEGERNYSPPGGHFDLAKDDVTAEDTLIREFKEEVGVDVNKKDLRKYRVFCEVKNKSSIEKTYLYFVGSWQGNLQPTYKTRFKWVMSDFVIDSKADDELKTVLSMLKKDDLID